MSKAEDIPKAQAALKESVDEIVRLRLEYESADDAYSLASTRRTSALNALNNAMKAYEEANGNLLGTIRKGIRQ